MTASEQTAFIIHRQRQRLLVLAQQFTAARSHPLGADQTTVLLAQAITALETVLALAPA